MMTGVMTIEKISELSIGRRFRGPANSGNGGYCCGMLAKHLEGDVEVTLRAPIPLERKLQVQTTDCEASLFDGAQEIARAGKSDLNIKLPEPPTLAAAAEARKFYAGFHDHLLPECFVCGPHRHPKDALRIFAGSIADDDAARQDMVAAPWTPDASLADENGLISAEYLWAALDCPGYFALRTPGLMALLGRMTARICALPQAGDRLIVVGWAIRRDGRKHVAGTALYTASGALLGCAETVWIELRRTANGA